MAESEEELKSLLMKVKDESGKLGLKLNIQKTKIMTMVPSLHGKQMGKKMEIVTNFIFLSSTITVNGDCSHKVKRCLLLAIKAMNNLDSILKSRDNTLPTKVYIIKAIDSPILMYIFESSDQFSCSVVSDFCNPMDCSMPGFPVHHQLPELVQTLLSS